MSAVIKHFDVLPSDNRNLRNPATQQIRTLDQDVVTLSIAIKMSGPCDGCHQQPELLCTQRPGNLVTYERHLDGHKSKMVANCPAWQYRRATGSQWSDVMPNSIGASAHRTVCSANIPTFMPKHTYSNTVQISCNEKVDAVFYRRYPELRGTKLTSMNGSLSREWISIQDSIC